MSMRPTIVLYEQAEQLGNRLIPFAHLLAFAEEHGCRVLNPGFRDYRPWFEGTRHGLTATYPSALLPDLTGERELGAWWKYRRRRLEKWVSQRLRLDQRVRRFLAQRCQLLDYAPDVYIDLEDPETIHRLTSSRLTFLYGWQLRAYGLAAKHREKLRAYFRPVASVRQEVETVIARCREQADTVIGVHVRRGDYEHFFDGAFYYSHEEFAQRMRHLLEVFAGRKVMFIICSNEPFPTEKLAGIPYVLGPGLMVSDLYVLAACNYLIAPPSTFSGWASFYNHVPLFIMKNRAQLPMEKDFKVFEEIELLYVDERLPRSESTRCR